MAHQVTITGAPNVGNTRPTPYPRRSIHELVKDTRQFSLYVQAVDAMMKAPATDPLSWYQISGIHGLPNTPWDKASTTKSRNGYCVHATPHFPTWHRPYVLLFEQALVTQAIRISQRYTGQDAAAWQTAAASLRAPYWDWAVNALPPNEVISTVALTVDGPQGKITLNPNPLLGYRYKTGDPRIDARTKTVRCPSRLRPDETDIRALTASLRVLDNPNDPMSDRVWTTLTDASTWNLFSNKATAQGRFRNSLESVHDDIHVLVGGNGQMSDPGLAAFDPIFWLHHTNVDRLLALWQALHPSGSQIWTADNPRFVPFWNGQTTFFDSAGIRPWSTLNYTYPEFAQVGPGTDPRTIQMAVLAEVRRLYLDEEDDTEDEVFAQAKATARTAIAKAPTPAAAAAAPAPAAPAPAAAAPAAAAPAAAPKQVVMAASPPAPGTQAVPPASAVHASPPAPGSHAKPPASATHGSPPAPGHRGTPPASAMHGVQKPAAAAHSVDTDQFPISIQHEPGAAGKHLDWFVRIRIPIGALDKSVTVLFFFGPAPKEEHEWREADNLVGTHAQFINSKPEDCDNCQTNRENRVVSEGVVRLTRALRRHNLYGKPTADIDKYLHDKLEWRLQTTDATVVDPSTVEGLEVAVMTVPLEFDHHGWGWTKREDVRPHHEEVTKHRPGGRHHTQAGGRH